MLWYVKSRWDLLFLETTDRSTARAKAVDRRIDVATVVEVQEVRVVAIAAVRRSRPIVAAVADISETAIADAAITRSRIPDGTCRTELAGEVHTLVDAAIQ